VQDLLYLNPVAVVITAYRSVLLDASWPQWEALAWVVVVGLLLLALGLRVINRYDRTYPKVTQ